MRDRNITPENVRDLEYRRTGSKEYADEVMRRMLIQQMERGIDAG